MSKLLTQNGKLLTGPGGKLLTDASADAMRDCCCEQIDCDDCVENTPEDCAATSELLPDVFYVDWYPYCWGNTGWDEVVPRSKKLTLAVNLIDRAHSQYFAYGSYTAIDGTPRYWVYDGICDDGLYYWTRDCITAMATTNGPPTPYVSNSGTTPPRPREYWELCARAPDQAPYGRLLYNGCISCRSPGSGQFRWRSVSPCIPDLCHIPVTDLPAALSVSIVTDCPYISPQGGTFTVARGAYWPSGASYYAEWGDMLFECICIWSGDHMYVSIFRNHLPSGWSGIEWCDAAGNVLSSASWSDDCTSPYYPYLRSGYAMRLPSTGEIILPPRQVKATDPQGVAHYWPFSAVVSWVP